MISGYHNELKNVCHVEKPVIIFGDHTQVVKYIDFDFVAGADGIKILLPIKRINSKYFYYILQLLMPKNIGYARHYKLLKKLEIPVPTLKEQEHIVSKLDKIFAEIEININKTNNLIKRTEILFQMYLDEVFKGNNKWKETTIKEITENTKNVNPKKSPNVKFKYVDVSSVSNKEFKIFETHLLFGKDAPSRAKKNIITNDIIFATVRPTLKRIAIVPKELNNQVASTGYAVLRTNKLNYFKFLFIFY